MKSNWSVYNNRLVYSGADFLGYVEPFVPTGLVCGEEYNYVKYRTWIYEGDGSYKANYCECLIERWNELCNTVK